MTGLMAGGRHFGWLQPLELSAYDQLIRLRQDSLPDDRLLIVAVTEADIRALKRWPVSDRTLAQLLQTLQTYQPRVIGVDIYRDIPQEPGNRELLQQLQASNVIGITKLGDSEDLGTPPPPKMLPEQIGFNDIASDPDGILRRTLLFANTETDTYYSFALRVALKYLEKDGIQPEAGRVNPENLRLGVAEFVPWEANSGGYQTADARGYQVLIEYRRRRDLARQVSLSQVLAGKVDPAWIKDKAILIGATARSAKDDALTPYSAGEEEIPWMPGVVVHGQIVSQILTAAIDQQPLFWFWSDHIELLWIGGWVLLGALLARLVRNPLAVGVYVAAALAVLLGSSYGLFLKRGWVPVATPALGLMTTAGLIVAYRAQQSQRQQQMIMKLLGQNTSPEIAKALWKSRDRLLKSGKLPGQRLVATMLFTDIRNFSTISEQMPPENLLEWLNEYLSAITQEVQVNQGIINKFTGDGLLAVFGVPMNRTTPVEIFQDAQLAVSCALAMGDRLRQLNQEWKQRGLPGIQMRVGIFTGTVVVGSLGGKDRLEYGVIGDSVNTASRLESYAKERQGNDELCRILIAKETLEYLEGKFEVEHWGPAALKGKNQMVDVYRVMGMAEPNPLETEATIPDSTPSGALETTLDPTIENLTPELK
jgi:CHASE2 domain-containing sensor protein/class 3 adenylate cyclase